MTLSPESRALFILKVLDTARSNVFPSEEEIAAMSPHVDRIRARYAELRGRDFDKAYLASRSEFIATAIREAENAVLERAAEVADAAQTEADSCSSHVVEEAIVADAVSECSGIIAQSIRSLKSKD